jgi:RND superfamily putative drug exporter
MSASKRPKKTEKAPSRIRLSNPLGLLGHGIAHHPWYAIGIWVVILIACILPAAGAGSVLNGQLSNSLPSSDQSVQAQNELAKQFPNQQSSPSSSIVILETKDIVGPVGKNATMAVTQSLVQDHKLKNVSSVVSLYSAYSEYLAGQVEFGWAFLGPALVGNSSLPITVNETASLLWAPAATYVYTWESIVNQTPSIPASQADWPAYTRTLSLFTNPLQVQVLTAFYNGNNGSTVGFNESINAGCLKTLPVTSCADDAMLSTIIPMVPTLFPTPSAITAAELVLTDLNLQNWSSTGAQQGVGATLLGAEVGISPSWLLTIWQAFPSTAPPTTTEVEEWVGAEVAENSISHFPLPIPSEIYSSFVNPANSATLIIVSFNVDDTYTVNGSVVTYGDVSEIQNVLSQVISSNSPYKQVSSYETGSAPLDGATMYLATSALGLLLTLTVIVLLVIMIIYFRTPMAPVLGFGMIGIALFASFAVIFVVGTFVTTFSSMIESIILVFLMAIGTDYSVFLLARYREELVRGTPSKQAVETTVRWAGQSITTSGLAVLIVSLALTFSGISFLNQLGIALFITVVMALVVNLTVLPSILAIAGPKIFWPNSGERFKRYAENRNRTIESNKDYIGQAGRSATRHPLAVIAIVVVISAPIVYVALQVPISYDITNIGLPSSDPAQVGYVHLTNAFGESYTSPSYALITFSQPLTTASGINTQEFTDVAGIADTINSTSGVSSVSSLVGAGGTPIDAWMNFQYLPPAVKISLNETMSTYVGADDKTVLFNIYTNSSGYSATTISVIQNIDQRIRSYDSSHPGVTKILFGGAGPITQDIRTMVNNAIENMLIGAAIGLFVLMLIILGSAFVPLLALAVIGLSILWSWAATYFVVSVIQAEALIFLLPLILIILVLGLGMDYNVLLLTRVKEERVRGRESVEAIREAVTHAGGVITAAAVILGGAFLLLGLTSPLGMIAGIGLGIGIAVILQAFVVQIFLTPAVLALGKNGIWKGRNRSQ